MEVLGRIEEEEDGLEELLSVVVGEEERKGSVVGPLSLSGKKLLLGSPVPTPTRQSWSSEDPGRGRIERLVGQQKNVGGLFLLQRGK